MASTSPWPKAWFTAWTAVIFGSILMVPSWWCCEIVTREAGVEMLATWRTTVCTLTCRVGGDLGVEPACGEQPQHLGLARAQPGVPGVASGSASPWAPELWFRSRAVPGVGRRVHPAECASETGEVPRAPADRHAWMRLRVSRRVRARRAPGLPIRVPAGHHGLGGSRGWPGRASRGALRRSFRPTTRGSPGWRRFGGWWWRRWWPCG
jgi:hypothetical protein